MLTLGTPLRLKGEPPVKDPVREMITVEKIYDCIAAPHPADIKTIQDCLLTTPDLTSCLNTLNLIKANKGLALADIIATLGVELTKLEVPPQTRIAWMEGLAEIEYRLSTGGTEVLQTSGLVGYLRRGVDLMEHGGT